MKQTVKTYTNSELFTLANSIRRSTNCSKEEAFAKAKAQLETPKAEKKVSASRGKKGSAIEVTANIKQKMMDKFNLKPGSVYPSVKELATYMGVSVQNVQSYIYSGVFKRV